MPYRFAVNFRTLSVQVKIQTLKRGNIAKPDKTKTGKIMEKIGLKSSLTWL